MALVEVAQVGFYVVTGAWPFVSMRAFEMVTGPRVDRRLVKTVGALAAIDTVYALGGAISRVYLLDALAELGLVAAWAIAWRAGAE
jgi:hypothetical protein